MLLSCLSKFGCKQTFDLHTDLAHVIHMCGPGRAGLMGRELLSEQTYEGSQTQRPQLVFRSDSSMARMTRRSPPLSLAVSLSHRLRHGQLAQLGLY